MTPRASLTRRVTFSAAHRYRRPEWDDARNEATFGLCARKNWHGHTYVCDVTVSGAVDPLTGFCADLGVLDRALRTRVVEVLDHRNLVLDVPAFAEGKLIPTTENLAWWIAREVQDALGASARVSRVRVAEEPGLWAEVEPA
ncbi:MAG: 6-carboxytetrahydropterin synthase [Gemmatimonadetes bacterium]|nr:6-carboxytetrahydropterin synthase [Gemmatimonadota bacterium]